MAQSVEALTHDCPVRGSSPVRAQLFFSVLERLDVWQQPGFNSGYWPQLDASENNLVPKTHILRSCR
ncbi:Multifunctional CCA protein [Frankliniella fusca]|uniref:Multifunctional CCA protein n=1 Tax=Frankliniella fusca TaxID=407009 RepID=A0AAE1I4J1_9NEOP|nr:Multifunctional CCA protein [Frankliniella fusca]